MSKVVDIDICPRQKYAYSKRWKVNRPHSGCKARSIDGLCQLHSIAKLGIDKGYLDECKGMDIRCVAQKGEYKKSVEQEHYGEYLDALIIEGDIAFYEEPIAEVVDAKPKRMDMGIFGNAYSLIELSKKKGTNTIK